MTKPLKSLYFVSIFVHVKALNILRRTCHHYTNVQNMHDSWCEMGLLRWKVFLIFSLKTPLEQTQENWQSSDYYYHTMCFDTNFIVCFVHSYKTDIRHHYRHTCIHSSERGVRSMWMHTVPSTVIASVLWKRLVRTVNNKINLSCDKAARHQTKRSWICWFGFCCCFSFVYVQESKQIIESRIDKESFDKELEEARRSEMVARYGFIG